MTKNKDDLDAVRILVATLEGFDRSDQERIIRWAKEKLGLSSEAAEVLPPQPESPLNQEQPAVSHSYDKSKTDIKSFVNTKNPKSDVHFAATIAYFYRFAALENQRKQTIKGGDLQEACRQVARRRLNDPGQTLRNAHFLGLLDKGSKLGEYSINTVGENLVAMSLPVGSSAGKKPPKTKPLVKKKDTKSRKKTSEQSAKKSSQ